jgi:cytochrome c oxidase cbb3-type subunit I/II
MDSKRITITYDDQTVRMFLLASVLWGAVGMLAGVLVAAQLSFHFLNFDTSWLTFGRLRPLHTNAAIFAFVGNNMFAGIYYSTQRLVKASLPSRFLSRLHFWGWQLIIVAAAITLPLGLTRGKEYAELIWPINIAVVLIWVVFAINFFWLLAIRREKSLYVAIWFYIATIVTVAMLYIVNHLQIPTSWTHGYPLFGGVQDALVQWWYGHNAVAFFLTTPILGMMYYFMPKAADRPVYSYRLSVVHFWSLVFIYIWAGPHHLLNTSLPAWLQSMGMLFSLMLWAPSWGGMLNGLLTLRGAWDKVRTDPVLKFFAAGVTFYGMATFEGPLLSIKSVNALSHFTDWTIGHVHSGTLGWNGFMAAGVIYFLLPRLWNRPLWSKPLAELHFWIGMVGILLYVASMWVSGITQGLMLNAVTDEGVLAYPNFIDALLSARTMLYARLVGGMLYLGGWLLLVLNVVKTISGATAVDGTLEVGADERGEARSMGPIRSLFNPPVAYSALIIVTVLLWGLGNDVVSFLALTFGVFTVISAVVHLHLAGHTWAKWYDQLLENWIPFTGLTFAAAAVGGLVQIIPTVILSKGDSIDGVRQELYTPLELAGRDLYIREGCYNCHSQQIRPFVGESLRYGPPSKLGESMFDHPYQWGSKRTGPDLARVGVKYNNVWHYRHMLNPRSTSPGSNMPNYPWLFERPADIASLEGRINALRAIGVPYPKWTAAAIRESAAAQAAEIAGTLGADGVNAPPDREIIALIAYLQKLGKTPKPATPAPTAPVAAATPTPR